MIRHAQLRRASIALGAFALVGFGAVGHVRHAAAMSCFSVAGKMMCIDAVSPAPDPVMPPVIVPVGVNGDNQEHHIVIEDDAGRGVARG